MQEEKVWENGKAGGQKGSVECKKAAGQEEVTIILHF